MQLPLSDKDGVQEFLDLGVASLGIRQDLANKVHMMMYYEGVSLSSRSTTRAALTTCVVVTT